MGNDFRRVLPQRQHVYGQRVEDTRGKTKRKQLGRVLRDRGG